MLNDDKAAVGVFVMTSLKWNKYTVINVTFHHRMMLLLWALLTALQSQARYAFKLNAPMLLMRRWMFALSAWAERKKIGHVNLRETLGGCGCFRRKLLMDLHIQNKRRSCDMLEHWMQSVQSGCSKQNYKIMSIQAFKSYPVAVLKVFIILD